MGSDEVAIDPANPYYKHLLPLKERSLSDLTAIQQDALDTVRSCFAAVAGADCRTLEDVLFEGVPACGRIGDFVSAETLQARVKARAREIVAREPEARQIEFTIAHQRDMHRERMAQWERELQDLFVALASWEQGVNPDAGAAAHTRMRIGQQYLLMGEHDTAIEYLRAAAEGLATADPGRAEAVAHQAENAQALADAVSDLRSERVQATVQTFMPPRTDNPAAYFGLDSSL